MTTHYTTYKSQSLKMWKTVHMQNKYVRKIKLNLRRGLLKVCLYGQDGGPDGQKQLSQIQKRQDNGVACTKLQLTRVVDTLRNFCFQRR